ncbi:MAG: hypothetical protein B6I37_09265 [Desulfobacteraceae bacterium 4572_35.2]|nr:MAG: hypothetical protein B6I37_09265 [Desulfobacteraceae bacterium 4572_35.2]
MLSTINSWPTTLYLADHTNCTWNKRQVLIKLFFHPHSGQRHYQREQHGVKLLIDNQLSTPALLFAGTLDDATPVLIFDYLPAAQTALERWTSFDTDQQRLNFLKKLMETIAKQHQCGIWQNDLHLENFLISDEVIYSIDGDDIQQQSQEANGLSRKKRRDNLALLFAQLPPQRESLFPTALAHYGHQLTEQSLTDWATIIDQELPLLRNKRRANYIQKSFRSCSEFVRHNSFNKISIFRRDIDPDLLVALQADPDKLMARGKMLKDGNSATVVAVEIANKSWVIKRYNIKNWWHALKRCWRPTRAWTSWGNAHRLSISQIKTPQPVAMIEKRFGPLRFGGYYVCAEVVAPNACEYLLDPQLKSKTKEVVKEEFVSIFKVLQQLKISHGDFKGTNFLIQDNEIWLIDLDAMSEFRSQSRFLGKFQADRSRFLRNWDDNDLLKQWFDNHLP